MGMTDDLQRRDAALDWLVRTNDPDFDAWDDFTAWLERDSANADAYHALAAGEAEMLPLVEAARETEEPTRRRVGRRGALVAGVAILAAAAAVLTPRLTPAEYQTAPGEVQIVSLGGRDQLVMNGDTSLQLTGFDRRTVRLEQGQILVRVRDPGQDKIAVISGDLRLVDVGTVFEVTRAGDETRVLVSEGAIIADPRGARLTLTAGQRLDTEDGAAVLSAMPADAASVGAFERGQLYYVDEPLGHVLADLSRSTGLDFSASEAIKARRFSGTLSVAEVERDPRSLGPLLGVPIERRSPGHWTLGGRV